MGGVDMGAIGAQVRGFLSGAAAKVSGTGLARGGGGNVQQQGAVGSPSNVNTAEIRQQFNDLAESAASSLIRPFHRVLTRPVCFQRGRNTLTPL